MYVFLQRVIWAHFDALWSYDRPIATNCSPNSIGFSAICTGNRQYLQLSEMTRIIIIDTFSILWYGHIMTCISPWETFQRMYTVLLTKIYRCCRQNLQTLICSQRMELVAASEKPVCWVQGEEAHPAVLEEDPVPSAEGERWLPASDEGKH